MSTKGVIVPSKNIDLSVLPRSYKWRCIAIATRGLLGITAVCTLVGFLTTLLALPLMVIVPPLLVVAEIIFAVIYIHKLAILNVQPIKHEPDNYDPEKTFDKFVKQIKQFEEVEKYLSLWFFGANYSLIKRVNVEEFVAYAFWYRQRQVLLAEGKGALLHRMVDRLEDTWGITFEPGYTPGLKFMSHLWEPIQHFYRPLTFYLWSEAMAGLTHIALICAGFKCRHFMGVAYYVRNMDAADSPSKRRKSRDSDDELDGHQNMPLVLLHGVGMGLLPYLGFMVGLAAAGHPLLAPQWRHVSMRLCLCVPTVDEVAEAVLCMMRTEHLTQACLVGHSYGTAVASRLIQAAPQRVHSMALMDPVCFGMYMPNMLRNFLYKSPSRNNLMADIMMWTAARDLHCSAAMSRKFYWSAVNLWEEQLPGRCMVVLSGRDVLVPTREVRMWLEWCTDAVIMFNPKLAHAAVCLDIAWQTQIIVQLMNMLKVGPHEQAARAASHRTSRLALRAPLPSALPQPRALSRSLISSSGSSINQWGQEAAGSGSSSPSSSRPISLLESPSVDYQQLISSTNSTPTGIVAIAAASRNPAPWEDAAGGVALSSGSALEVSRSHSLEPVYESPDEDSSMSSVGLLSSSGQVSSPAQQELPVAGAPALPSSSRSQEQGAASSANSVLLNKQVNAGRRLQVLMGGMRSTSGSRSSVASSSRRSSGEYGGAGAGSLPGTPTFGVH